MDTNLLTVLVSALADKQVSHSGGVGSTGLIIIVLAALAPTLTSLVGLIQAKTNAAISDKNSQTLDKVHTAVNSERTEMIKEVKNLRAEVALLLQIRAVQAEHKLGEDKASVTAVTEAKVLELIKQNKP